MIPTIGGLFLTKHKICKRVLEGKYRRNAIQYPTFWYFKFEQVWN